MYQLAGEEIDESCPEMNGGVSFAGLVDQFILTEELT